MAGNQNQKEAERKQAEAKLRASEEKYRNLVERANDGIAIIQDGRLKYVNPSLAKMAGYAADEALEKPFTDFVPPDELVDAVENYKRLISGEQLQARHERTIIHKNGSRIETEVDATSITYHDSPAVMSIFRDITERKRTQNLIRESEEKYRLLVNNLPGIVYKGFKDFSVEFFDNKIESLTGYPLAEFNSKRLKWSEIIAPADLKPSKERFIQALKTDKSYIREYRITTKGKDTLWIRDRGQIVCDAAGEIEYVSGIFFDITDRKHIEETLYKEKEKFRILVEESPLGISLIGKDGRYEYVNPRFTELFGYNLKDVPDGRAWFKKAYPDPQDRHQVISTWINDLKESEAGQSRPRIFNVRCKDGSEKVISFKPVTMQTGLQLVIYEDLTERKHLEIQLRQAQKMEAVGTLAGGIAHDFNNILLAVMGNAEISLYSLPEQSPVRSSIEQILKASERARDLVKQILTFSRQSEYELKPIKVSVIVQEALKLLRASLPTTIEIRHRITADRDTILADPTQIHQVLMNLCTNADHAMRERGGVLNVSLSNATLDFEAAVKYPDLRPGSYLQLTVSDTGHGMPPEVLERIFDPYFTTKEKGVGTGLGLAVIHGIVIKMNGAISVDSQLGQGTTFCVFFPLTEVKDTLESRDIEAVPLGNERILFVDDEEFIADLGKQMLERLGYDVVVRTSSIEALKAFQARPDKFDLIITDMTMPQMTGEKLAQKLLEIRPDIPIILCTGYSATISENKAKEMGIKGFVMKPFVIQELAKMIRRVLEE